MRVLLWVCAISLRFRMQRVRHIWRAPHRSRMLHRLIAMLLPPPGGCWLQGAIWQTGGNLAEGVGSVRSRSCRCVLVQP